MCVPVFGVSGVPLVFGMGGGPFFLENKNMFFVCCIVLNVGHRHCDTFKVPPKSVLVPLPAIHLPG